MICLIDLIKNYKFYNYLSLFHFKLKLNIHFKNMNVVYKVKVKWGKKVFKDVELDVEESFEMFFATLYSLSLVPVEKMRILYKGKFLKVKKSFELNTYNSQPEMSPKDFKLKNNAIFMLIGKAEGAKTIQKPKEEVIFMEDLTPDQRAKLLNEKVSVSFP